MTANSQSPRQPFKRSEAGAKGGAPKGNQNAKKNNQKQAKQAKVDLVELKQAKQADIRYTIYDNDLLPNGNKKESKKESGSFDAILREYTGDEETLSLLGEWLKVRKAKRAYTKKYQMIRTYTKRYETIPKIPKKMKKIKKIKKKYPLTGI